MAPIGLNAIRVPRSFKVGTRRTLCKSNALHRRDTARCRFSATVSEARTSPRQVIVTTSFPDFELPDGCGRSPAFRQKSLAEQTIPSA
jgi:hypothetical protein